MIDADVSVITWQLVYFQAGRLRDFCTHITAAANLYLRFRAIPFSAPFRHATIYIAYNILLMLLNSYVDDLAFDIYYMISPSIYFFVTVIDFFADFFIA